MNPVVLVTGQTENIAHQRKLAEHYRIPLFTIGDTQQLKSINFIKQ
jgi:hypothetical protein